MITPLHNLLEHLSATLDVGRQAAVAARYQLSLDWQPVDRPPLVISYPVPVAARFQPFPHREIFDDPEKMLYNELVCGFSTSIALRSEIGDDLPLTVRANFGTVLMASMFGAVVEQTGDNPPWIVHHEEAEIGLAQIAAADPQDFSRGWIPRAAATMQAYHDLLGEFPELKKLIRIVLPDLQGPFDNLELVRGSNVFAELVTDPEAVERALATLATAQINLARHFGQWTTEPQAGYLHQHAVMLKGHILLRNDCCIMVSPEMYREQIAPHDERVLRELGGGAIHSCGQVGHLVDDWLALPSLRALDLGQPEMNDLDSIYAKARAKQIPLIRVAVSEAEIASGAAWRRFPTGVVLIHRAPDFAAACQVAEESGKSITGGKEHL
jgi:hypothetical protein